MSFLHLALRWRSLLLVLVVAGALAGTAVAVPTVTAVSPPTGATVNSLGSIAVTFSEAVTGVDAGDLLINNDAALTVTGSGAGPYTFTFTQPLPGSVNISWDFDHGIAGIGTGAFVQGTWSYTLIDTLPPTIAAVKSSVTGQEQDAIVPLPGATVGTLTQVEVTFSEAVVGVDAGDLLVNGIPALGVTGTGAGPYVFTFNQPPAGAVLFQWAAGHGIQDTAPVPNNFAGGSWTVTLSASGVGSLVISEFLAANATGLADEDGEQPGWIEIYNSGASPVNLAGWALTNSADTPGMWVFPSRTIAAGNYLVVFTSGKDRKPASGNLHTNFKLNANGDYLALVSPQSPRGAVVAFNPFPPQRYDYSYGLVGGVLRYFSPSTPGSANTTATYTGVTAKPDVSVSRGFFKDPFQLVVSCATPGATVRYTLDGSVPTATSTAYTGPLSITGTTVLRLVALGATTIPSETVTHSYIYLDQVFNQAPPPYNNPGGPNNNTSYPATPSVGGVSLPVAWGTQTGVSFPGLIPNLNANQIPADYGMRSVVYNDANKYDDTGTINNTTGKTNLDRIKQGLRDLPIISVVMKVDDMFGASGLYPNSTLKGAAYQKPCSIEMLLPDGSTAFATTTGVQLHGNASRTPGNNPKHALALNFKGDYGAANLDYQLFPDSPVTKLDDIILRGDYNSSWTHWDGSSTLGASGGQRARGTRLRDAFCKDTFRAMGRVAGHHRYVNLFIDGVYWGVYDATEKEAATFAANYFGGDKGDYDVIEQGTVKSGTNTAYAAMTAIVSPIDNTKYEQMKGYLDVPEFIDYMLLHFWVGHQDWGDDINKNWYAVRNAKSGGTFKYLPWDQENLLWDQTIDRTTVSLPPSGLHTKLVSNAQYQLDFADRVHRQMVAPDGPLQPAAAIARLGKWKAVLRNAIAAESARWGDYRKDVHNYSSAPYPLYTWNSHWVAELNRLTGTYFTNRNTNQTTASQGVMPQLRSSGLYPMLNAPEIRDNGTNLAIGSQRVSAGFQAKMQFPSTVPVNKAGTATTNTGTIYFTTDGSDPRVYYTGAIAAAAQVYATPVTINTTTRIKARALNGVTWSALNELTLTVGFVPQPVRITEIMYHPTNGMGADAAEFIELQNTSTASVDMSGWYLEGVDFVFPNGFSLDAGDRIVLASNNAPATFAAQYPGVAVAGYFGGTLDNGGERLALNDASGRTIVSVDYDDEGGWPTQPDGQGNSLEIIDPNGNPDDPANWKASAGAKGTPGVANSVAPVSMIEISEVLATNASTNVGGSVSDFVELRNNGSAPFVLDGWSLSNDGSPRKFTFPSGTTIAAFGYLVVLCDAGSGGPYLHTGFTLNGGPTGDRIQLYDSSPTPVRIDGVSWGNQIADKSIGKVSGTWTLCVPTPAGANTATALAGAGGNLVLNEWLANAAPGGADWIELYNKHASLPVALKGVYIQTPDQLFQIQVLAFVAPHGWLQLFADKQTGANQLDLKLAANGMTLSLLDGAGVSLDSVAFGAQDQGVTQGRNPDGSATIATFTGSASPGAANYVSTWSGPVLNEILARNVNGALAPWGAHADWFELANPTAGVFDLTGMRIGATNDFNTAWTIPAGTTIAAGGWLAFWCDATQPASVLTGANLNTGFPLGDASGGLYVFNAAGQLVNQVEWGFQVADQSIGVDSGTWKLLASATRGAANSAAATLGAVAGLRINEWMALQSSSAATDWFELYNSGSSPVAMAGLYLSDDPSELGRAKFQVPLLSFIAAGGWVKWEADGESGLGRNHVNFGLNSSGETLRLSNNDANFTVVDTVTFGLQSPDVSQGRITDGAANIVAMPGSPTPGARNVLLPAPTFSSHPSSQVVTQGANVTLSALAYGSAPLTYQWRFNGGDIANATGTSLVLNGIAPANDGTYVCVASNTAGAVSSNAAVLMIKQTFSQWAASNGIGAGADPMGDDDLDGITNGIEFLHHLSPTIPATNADRAALQQVGMEWNGPTPQYLTLTYRQNARAAFSAITLQASPSLAAGSWGNVTPDVTESLAPDAITGDPIFRMKVLLGPGDVRKFLRLQLTP
jgi:hypothetical protein